jgi:hypothetical protein
MENDDDIVKHQKITSFKELTGQNGVPGDLLNRQMQRLLKNTLHSSVNPLNPGFLHEQGTPH